jgi:hypothetical protein
LVDRRLPRRSAELACLSTGIAKPVSACDFKITDISRQRRPDIARIDLYNIIDIANEKPRRTAANILPCSRRNATSFNVEFIRNDAKATARKPGLNILIVELFAVAKAPFITVIDLRLAPRV